MEVVALETSAFTPTFKVDFTELLRLYLEYHIPKRLICGVSVV